MAFCLLKDDTTSPWNWCTSLYLVQPLQHIIMLISLIGCAVEPTKLSPSTALLQPPLEILNALHMGTRQRHVLNTQLDCHSTANTQPHLNLIFKWFTSHSSICNSTASLSYLRPQSALQTDPRSSAFPQTTHGDSNPVNQYLFPPTTTFATLKKAYQEMAPSRTAKLDPTHANCKVNHH